MTQRLLLTGGTGFFGRALLRQFHSEAALSSAGLPHGYHEVRVVSRNPKAFAARYTDLALAPWLHWISADVTHSPSLAVLAGPVDVVLHAATDSTDAGGMTPINTLDQIVQGTRNVLDLAVRLNARRFLFTSSGGAYGPQPAGMEQIPETYLGMPDPLVAGSTYGLGKRLAEHLCFLYGQQHGLEVVIARCFAFLGPDLPLNVHFAIGNFIRDALWAEEIVVNGDGTPLRTYLDQRDLAVWLTSLLADGISGQAYNVGSDQVVSISELAYLVRDLVSPDKPVRILGAPQTNKDRNRYVPDIAKIYEHLNLSPTFSLRQSILEMAKTAQSKGKEVCLAA